MRRRSELRPLSAAQVQHLARRNAVAVMVGRPEIEWPTDDLMHLATKGELPLEPAAYFRCAGCETAIRWPNDPYDMPVLCNACRDRMLAVLYVANR